MIAKTHTTAWNAGKKIPPEPLTDEEIHRIYTFLDSSDSARALRARAYVTLCLRGLLRCKEALSLYPKDMLLDEGILRVLHGKGDKSRTIGIDKKACLYVKEWMDERAKMGIGENSPVICTIHNPRRGRPLGTNWARQMVQRLGKNCGIHRRVHSHGFRHTGAIQMLQERAPLHVISKQLGHTHLATTEKYLQWIHPGTIINWMQNRVWHDQHWNAVPSDKQIVLIRESKKSTGYVVLLKAPKSEKYLRFPDEIVGTLPEATFFESRAGANAAVEQLLPQIDLRYYTPDVQPAVKGA